MSGEPRTLAVTQAFHILELERPGLPSANLREQEARLIAELARTAHHAGYRFDGWPSIELHTPRDPLWFGGTVAELGASVTAVPA